MKVIDPPHPKRYQYWIVGLDENAEGFVEIFIGELLSSIPQHHSIRLGAVQFAVVPSAGGVHQEEGPQVALLQVLDTDWCRGEDVVLCHVDANCTQLLHQVCSSALCLITAQQYFVVGLPDPARATTRNRSSLVFWDASLFTRR